MTAPQLPRAVRWCVHLLTLWLFLASYAVFVRHFQLLPVIVFLWASLPMVLFLFMQPSSKHERTSQMGIAALGPIYVGLPLVLMVFIDRCPTGNGNLWIVFLLVVIFASDTGAFYFGRLFGTHKLYEAISPGKTWEGAVGGLFSSLIAAAFFMKVVRLQPVNPEILILAFVLSVSGQVGDLTESMLKRNHNVKDSGQLLPGHGGILDRIDGLLFAIPILYVYLYLWIV